MTPKLRLFTAALFAIALSFTAAAPAPAQSITPDQRGEIEKIIREYLLTHPELRQEVRAVPHRIDRPFEDQA
jgi:hypothetical protein